MSSPAIARSLPSICRARYGACVNLTAGNVIEGIFGVVKPMIGVVHLLALPGSSSFDRDAGMAPIVAAARRDTDALLEAGVDGIIYSNEGDLPYRVDVGVEQATAMAAVVGELKPLLDDPVRRRPVLGPARDAGGRQGGRRARSCARSSSASTRATWGSCGPTRARPSPTATRSAPTTSPSSRT